MDFNRSGAQTQRRVILVAAADLAPTYADVTQTMANMYFEAFFFFFEELTLRDDLMSVLSLKSP